jgi:hypothetical protein
MRTPGTLDRTQTLGSFLNERRRVRLTCRLRGDEVTALATFALDHACDKSTALRVILRERLLGERLPVPTIPSRRRTGRA